MIRRALCCLLLFATLGAGCGSDDQAPPADKGEVATLVNEYFAALRAEDAQAACARLTDRGEELLIRLAGLGSGEAIEGCEQAASVYGKFLSDAERASEGASKQVFAAGDVVLQAGGEEAEVGCEPRGAIGVERTDGEWLISAPACVN